LKHLERFSSKFSNAVVAVIVALITSIIIGLISYSISPVRSIKEQITIQDDTDNGVFKTPMP